MNRALQHLRKRVLPARLSMALVITGFGGAVLPMQAVARTVAPVWTLPSLTTASPMAITPELAKALSSATANSARSSNASSAALVGAGVVLADGLLGQSLSIGKTGLFTPAPTLSSWLASGSGKGLGTGLVLSEGLVCSAKAWS